MSSAQFRASLEAGDYMGMWRIMAGAFPGTPQPKTPQQAEIIMHRIRTETESLSDRVRCYSDKWLEDHNCPSGLPDRLKASSLRLYPRVVDAVGIGVHMPRLFREIGEEVEQAMSVAVEEVHADGVDLDNRPVVHGHMFAARDKTLKVLLGRLSRPLRDYK